MNQQVLISLSIVVVGNLFYLFYYLIYYLISYFLLFLIVICTGLAAFGFHGRVSSNIF